LTRTVPPEIGRLIVGVPVKFRTIVGGPNGEFKSVSVVSVVPLGLKKNVGVADVDHLNRFVLNTPLAVVLE
jgi:hypothetical protein